MESHPKEVHHEIHKHFPPPLKKAPKEIQDQFISIMKDKTIHFEDKPKKMHELAQKVLKGDLLKEFNEFQNEMEEHKKKIKEMKLSPEAKEAYEKIRKLKMEKHEILHKLSEPAHEELSAILKERHHKFSKPF